MVVGSVGSRYLLKADMSIDLMLYCLVHKQVIFINKLLNLMLMLYVLHECQPKTGILPVPIR